MQVLKIELRNNATKNIYQCNHVVKLNQERNYEIQWNIFSKVIKLASAVSESFDLKIQAVQSSRNLQEACKIKDSSS